LEKNNQNFPNTWEKIKFEDIVISLTDFQSNGSFAKLKENVKKTSTKNYAILVRLKDLRTDIKNSDLSYTDKHGYDFLKKSHLFGGEILVSNVGSVGVPMVMPKILSKAALAPNMFQVSISENISKKYFLYFIESPQYLKQIDSHIGGSLHPKMNKTQFKTLKIPLPPLNEQKRIISKIKKTFS